MLESLLTQYTNIVLSEQLIQSIYKVTTPIILRLQWSIPSATKL